ncbi:hypothetical protein GGS24DRAFT_100300 [Hypoxylon argillaceum]|nr:hypothetical protein GGS24DRAFT_100300 [Hypoxylon argillaceum]KAI1152603.1 hypothetical protein F4825DRAFT_305073 [Nemania diffusa]
MATQTQNSMEDIPPLTSISPSVFVPTDRDFTKTPPPLSDDPITRLETTIDALDWHAARVEENMVAMFVREAERVRQAGQVERVQYDSYHRPIKDQQRRMEDELRLEEMILREDNDAMLKIFTDGRYRENEDTSSNGREDPRERRPYHRPRSPPPGCWGPEYADLATLRREKMFRQDSNEFRQTPRSTALTHVLNLVKWGWDEQLEGHRAAIKKEKEERRAKLLHQMKENPFPLATTRPSLPSPSGPALSHKKSTDGDAMDLD